MSGGYQDIDLSSLAPPDVVEQLDYETIFAGMKAELVRVMPEFDATLESDPAMKVLQVAAYHELNLRQRVNDAGQAVMLAHSTGADLDHLAALFGVQRQVIDPGAPDALPPVPPKYEADDSLRRRTQLSLEGQTVAGSEGAYVFHALSVAGVKDASVASPTPGEVVVTILALDESEEDDSKGVPEQALLDEVLARLDGRDVRPLTDHVTVQPVELVEYAVQAELSIGVGPDADVVLQAAAKAVQELTESSRKLGRNVPLSAIYAALHQPGVGAVKLPEPAASVVVAANQSAFCTSVAVTRSQG